MELLRYFYPLMSLLVKFCKTWCQRNGFNFEFKCVCLIFCSIMNILLPSGVIFSEAEKHDLCHFRVYLPPFMKNRSKSWHLSNPDIYQSVISSPSSVQFCSRNFNLNAADVTSRYSEEHLGGTETRLYNCSWMLPRIPLSFTSKENVRQRISWLI